MASYSCVLSFGAIALCIFEGYLIITIVSSFISLTPMTNIDSVNPPKLYLLAPPPPYSFALTAPI